MRNRAIDLMCAIAVSIAPRRFKAFYPVVAILFFGLFFQVGHAAETVTYTYDALGRLVATAHSGGVNNGLQTGISYDPAGNRSNYSVSGSAPLATLSISDASTTEGGALVFTVTKNGNGAGSANWTTANGSAGSGSDYTATSGTISFTVSEVSKTISVDTIDDADFEPAETLTVALSSPSAGAAIGTATGTGTISDNDVAPSFAISNAAAVTEGGALVYTVTRAGNLNGSYSVNFATANGTATVSSDYTANSGTLTFAAGETSKTISVATISDFTLEPNETVLVNLSAPTGGATITASQGSGTINNDDYAPPSFAVSNATAVTEGGTLVFTVTKTGTTNTSYNVNFATANGTATVSSDYTANSGTLTFAAGETSKTISVATVNDTGVESAETVLVNLSGASGGATITTGQASGTINDNDVSFAISNAAAVTEGGTLVFTVTRNGVTSGNVSVNFATANGTAVVSSDYTANSGTLTFASGEASKTISVATISDFTLEPNETVLVNLSAPTGGATITTSQGSGTINNDDYAPPSFAIANATMLNEGGTLVFTVTKTGTTNTSYGVNFATANGTATVSSDYTATSGTLTFAANETTKTISVVTINDFEYEPTESVLVNLSGATGGATISTGQASGSLFDDDYEPPIFAISNAAAVDEGGTLVFTVTKTGTTNTSHSLNYSSIISGSATPGSDYNSVSGTLTFAAGETSKTISVTTIDDTATEGSETVVVRLNSATGGAGVVGTGEGIGTINASDAPSCRLDLIAHYGGTITEWQSARFFVRKLGTCPASQITVNYWTSNGTAQANVHYQPFNGFREFMGNTSEEYPITIDVPTYGGDYSTPLTFVMHITSYDEGVTIGTSSATLTIYDD
jgi:hypothetical protein